MIAFPISLKSTKVIPRETFITRPFATKSKAPDVFFEEKNLSESVAPLFSIPYFLTKKGYNGENKRSRHWEWKGGTEFDNSP